MIRIRQSDRRGATRLPWLDGKHSFSFNRYYDPEWMGFRSLRVINEDRVRGGGGFGTHPHDNMEILTYVMEGALKHADSMGNSSTINAGELQRMTAGTGITHSEINPSPTDTVHLFQIWIEPEQDGLTPSYEQRAISPEETQGKLRLVAARGGAEDSMTIHQDAQVYLGRLASGEQIAYLLRPKRGGWLQVMRGEVDLNGQTLREGDGAAIEDETSLKITATADAQIILFDLA